MSWNDDRREQEEADSARDLRWREDAGIPIIYAPAEPDWITAPPTPEEIERMARDLHRCFICDADVPEPRHHYWGGWPLCDAHRDEDQDLEELEGKRATPEEDEL